MELILKPFKGVGDFNFGDSIASVTDNFDYELIPLEDEGGSDLYALEDIPVTLGVNDDVIDAVFCDEECIYKGKNIIGMTIEEFMSHTGEKYHGDVEEEEDEDDDVPVYIYEFEEIGIQIWEKGKGGSIISVIASDPSEED
jgi:hypothetical protein